VLWNGSWIAAPEYRLVEDGDLLSVEATRPIVPLGTATGRVISRPVKKTWRFLTVEGPGSTYRKARAKLRASVYSGDYHVVAVLGRSTRSGKRVVALGCRLPPCATTLLVHQALVVEVDEGFSAEELASLADELAAHDGELERLGGERYLYSGNEPPPELRERLRQAFRGPSAAARSVFLTPTDGPPEETQDGPPTLLRLPGPNERTGKSSRGARDTLPVALLGAGEYARTEIIPALRRHGLALHVVADREPQVAARVGEEHGFPLCTTDAELAIDELPRGGLVVVATAHDSHAGLAAAALRAGHRVFLEKPPVVTEDDLDELVSAWSDAPTGLDVGFNRRYVGLVARLRALLREESGPITVTCIVRELSLEPGHWYFWPNQGTRITGNLCHWIDLACHLLEDAPLPVTVGLPSPVAVENRDEERVLTVGFDDGSLVTIAATERGDDVRGVQELIDVRRGATTALVDDLKRLTVLRGGRTRRHRALWRDKGHRAMYDEAIRRALAAQPGSYPIEDLIRVSTVQIAAAKLATTHVAQIEIGDRIEKRLQLLQSRTVGAGRA
jgi:predicted dehydrogenase